jgi:hypothetical protein
MAGQGERDGPAQRRHLREPHWTSDRLPGTHPATLRTQRLPGCPLLGRQKEERPREMRLQVQEERSERRPSRRWWTWVA